MRVLSSSVDGVIFSVILTTDTQVTGPRSLCESERFHCQKPMRFLAQSDTACTNIFLSSLLPSLSLRPLSSGGKNRTKDLGQNQESGFYCLTINEIEES